MAMQGAEWWRHAVIYQIYPLSFQDANGDGYGDLRGIIDRLDYLAWLGVDAIWLSPIYPSPMADFGYDVSDYTAIAPMFGSLDDFDALVTGAHERGLRVILDFVPNHTSNEHPWFIESRSSRNNPRRDWYLWRDPAPDGGPPNNWLSVFGGSAWTYDAATGQYYYHAFLREQPDLNWRNPAVRDAMHTAMRFWLDRGVDGFRLDAIWHLIKDDQFRDNPPNPDYQPEQPPYFTLTPLYSTDRPEIHDLLAELRAVVDRYPDRLVIGEIYLPTERLIAYYGRDLKGLHLPFNFLLIKAPWHARNLAALIGAYEQKLPAGGWPNWVLGNHDKPRIATRAGPDQAPVAAMLLLTLRGTATLYYGDELGMEDVPIPPARVRDPWELNLPGAGHGRDPARTPMQWDASTNAGFSPTEPWLPIATDYRERNVERLRDNPRSILQLYRRLIELRRRHAALRNGLYREIAATGDLLAYVRRDATQSFLIALNLGGTTQELALGAAWRGRIVLDVALEREGEVMRGVLPLGPANGVVVQLDEQ
jgi:alpha-glucosidase